jgi:hypothetical protein
LAHDTAGVSKSEGGKQELKSAFDANDLEHHPVRPGRRW